MFLKTSLLNFCVIQTSCNVSSHFRASYKGNVAAEAGGDDPGILISGRYLMHCSRPAMGIRYKDWTQYSRRDMNSIITGDNYGVEGDVCEEITGSTPALHLVFKVSSYQSAFDLACSLNSLLDDRLIRTTPACYCCCCC
jgi:hypothetical protein